MFNSAIAGVFSAEWSGSNKIFLSQKLKDCSSPAIENTLLLNITYIGGETVFLEPEKFKLYMSFEPQQNFADGLSCSIPVEFCCTILKSAQGKTFYCVSPIDDFSLEEGESISIQFENLVCFDDVERIICLQIQYEGLELQDKPSIGYLPIIKKYTKLKTRRFVSDKSNVGILDSVNFIWEAVGHPSECLFLPGYDENGANGVKSFGTTDFEVIDSTTFAIMLKRGKETVYETLPVKVEDCEIISFTADNYAVDYGKEVTLFYELKNTYHGYINNGIGRVDAAAVWKNGKQHMNGSCKVIPVLKDNEYILTILGKDKLIQKNIKVTVNNYMEVEKFIFYRKLKGDNYDYTIKWSIKNCSLAQIYFNGSLKYSGSIGDYSFQVSRSTAAGMTSIAVLKAKSAGSQIIENEYEAQDH